jgi:hypothetical protein
VATQTPPAGEELTSDRRGIDSTFIIAIIAAIVLGLAAILTAWSSYRESLTSDGVLKNYAEQQALISQANDVFAQADQLASIERQYFLQFAIASAEGNLDVEDYLIRSMDEDLYLAISWWLDEPDETRPLSPFVEDNPEFALLGSQLLTEEGLAILDEADERRSLAEEADANSDRFDLANVFFAVVLFLAGIATLLQRRGIQIGIISLGGLMMIAGVVVLVTTPGWNSLN